MSTIKFSDFYYGSVLSMLFSHKIQPALVENGNDRRVYDFTTNNTHFTLFIKYRREPINVKKDGYNSWSFLISQDVSEILKYISEGKNVLMALVCGHSELEKSQLAILDSKQLKELIELNKKTITISRAENEKSFRIPRNKSRGDSILVKCSRFDEMF